MLHTNKPTSCIKLVGERVTSSYLSLFATQAAAREAKLAARKGLGGAASSNGTIDEEECSPRAGAGRKSGKVSNGDDGSSMSGSGDSAELAALVEKRDSGAKMSNKERKQLKKLEDKAAR